jgi:hypothetical protein
MNAYASNFGICSNPPVHMVHIELILLGTSRALLLNTEYWSNNFNNN